jgi:hypothetical protein
LHICFKLSSDPVAAAAATVVELLRAKCGTFLANDSIFFPPCVHTGNPTNQRRLPAARIPKYTSSNPQLRAAAVLRLFQEEKEEENIWR